MGNEVSSSRIEELNISEEDKILTIIDKTNFRRAEGLALYKNFKQSCYPHEYLTKSTFDKAFPQFAETELQVSIFRAMDKDSGGSIDFEEYIQALSIIARGTADQKADLALKILDLDGNSKIEKEELIRVCETIASIMKKYGIEMSLPVESIINRIYRLEIMSEQEYKDFKGYVNISQKKAFNVSSLFNFFKKSQNDQPVSLSYQEFKKRAITDANFQQCFGLFVLFYKQIVKPIEESVNKGLVSESFGLPYIAGYLRSPNWQYSRRYVVVENGFMNFYENENHYNLLKENWYKVVTEKSTANIWNDDDSILQELKQLSDKAKSQRSIAVSITNRTKYSLISPQTCCTSGKIFKAPEKVIKPNEYTIFTAEKTGIARGVVGGISYLIDDKEKKEGSRKRLAIMFQIPYDYNLYSNLFNLRIIDENEKMDERLLESMRATADLDSEVDMTDGGFHLTGKMGSDSKKLRILKTKSTLRIEIHHADHSPPPNLVCTLAESAVYQKPGTHNTLLFSCGAFSREFEVEDYENIEKWIYAIQKNRYPMIPNPFNSFAPIRKNTGCRYFIGGCQYFAELARCLKMAKREIMITAWFLTPTLWLTRTKEGKVGDQLHEILKERAEHGVKVYVLVWDEIDAAFRLGSKEVKKLLRSLHRNIIVLRDPRGMFDIWSHHQKTVIIDQDIAFCGGIDIAYNRYEDIDSFPLTDWPDGRSQFPGRDYVNPMLGENYIGDPYETVLKRHNQPRMPWQDIQVKLVGEVARDLARNFIQRWNKSKKQRMPYIPLKNVPPLSTNDEPYPNCTVQCLRSACEWSVGLKTTEHSLYTAHLDAIEKAQHYIYIENQFFCSATSEGQINPQNKIAKALVDKIIWAIDNKRDDFRIIFNTPVHSASNMEGLAAQILTYWQYNTSTRGSYSMAEYLRSRRPNADLDKYFHLVSMRNYGYTQDGKVITEMIYVHSKLMIVDDKVAFISSANINDRSMLGDRDSEIGVRIEDVQTVNTTMNGKDYKSGKFVYDLRMDLFRMFLGLPKDKSRDAEIADPIIACDKLVAQAKENTRIYLYVFDKIEDRIYRSEDLWILTDYQKKYPAKNVEELKKLKGYIILFPKYFLKHSYSDPSVNPTSINKFFV